MTSNIHKNYQKIKNNNTLYKISSFLDIQDKFNFMKSKNDIYYFKNILLKNDDKNKKVCIITRFFRKALFVFKELRAMIELDKKLKFGEYPIITPTDI